MGRNTSLLLNSLVHVLILFSFLTIFFMFVVSGLERDAIDGQVKELIDTNMGPAIEKADTDGALKKVLEKMSDAGVLKTLEEEYDSPSQDTVDWNNWVFYFNKTVLASLIILVGTVLYTLSQSCGMCPNYAHLFWENLIIFGAIGTVEYLFFMNIAKNYVPVAPSFMEKQLVDDLKNELASS
jgi:hypothetical protein